jgi:hypothetical protein
VDIEPASMDQVVAARDGRTVVIDRDLGDVALQLRQIDPSLVLRYHPETHHYSVIQRMPDRQEQLVATCQPIPGGAPHPKLIETVARVASSSYDVASELRAADTRRIREEEHRAAEETGLLLEEAYHRFKRQTGIQNRVFVPRSVR